MHSTNLWNVELGVVLNQEFDLEKKLGTVHLILYNRAWQYLSYVRDLGLRQSAFDLSVKDEQGAAVPFTGYGTNFFVPLYPKSIRDDPLSRLMSGGGRPGRRTVGLTPGEIVREGYTLSDIVRLKPGRYSLTVSATISGPEGRARLTVPDIPFVVKPTEFANPAKPPEESSAPQAPDQ